MYIEKYLTVGLLVGLNIYLCESFASFGPAQIIIERFEQCDDPEKYPMENDIVLEKINRTTAGVTGCLRLPEDIGPTSSIQLDLSKWGDGGWKPNAYNIKENDTCEVIQKYIKTTYEEILELNGQKNEGCPLKKTDLCFKQHVVSLGKIFPSVLYGKFKADVFFFIDLRPIFCLRAFLISTPTMSG